MYIFVIILILILTYFCYKKKNNIMEGLENPPGFTNVGSNQQPRPAVALYDFNLPQALDIWRDAGCTEGSKKPSENNDHWKHEGWKEEVLHYKKESDKLFEEHNYYDWTGKISGEEIIRDKNNVKSYPIGIGEAQKRCHDKNFNSSYTYPKIGDRVKKKRHPTTDKLKTMKGDYYVGTVLEKVGDKVKILWDALGSDKSSAPDSKRLVTRKMPVEIGRSHSNYNKLKNDTEKFGWPRFKWGRMPERGNSEWEKKDAEKVSWARGDSNSLFNNKELYKVEECKQDNQTDCDYLKCGKRKKNAISNYPITYVCDGDTRNTSDDQWYCPTSGTVSTYQNKRTMCKRFFKTGKPNTFCNERCDRRYGGNNCVPFKNASNIKSNVHRSDKCIGEVVGKDKQGLTRRAILREKKNYTKSSILSKHGMSSISSVGVKGSSRCRIYKNGSKSGNKSSNGSFSSIKIMEEDPKVKLYTRIGGKNYILRAHKWDDLPNKKMQYDGAKLFMLNREKNAIWVESKYGGDTFTWKNGKLCTISPDKCCLQWDGDKGRGSEMVQGVGSQERNAKFDCNSSGDKFTYSGNKFRPTSGRAKRCNMEWSSKKFRAKIKYKGRTYWYWPNSRQAKFDCKSRGDSVRFSYQN